MKAAPHPNAGKLLMSFVLSVEGQRMLCEQGRIPSHPDVDPRIFSLRNVKLIASDPRLAKEYSAAGDEMRAIFGAMIWRFYKDTGSPDQGYEWLRKLDANVKEYTADGTLLMQKLGRREGLVTLWDMPDVRLFKEQKSFPVDYSIPRSGTPVIIDGIAIVRGAANQEEAKRFYEFVTTPESLAYAANKYYRIPVRTDLDRSQLPGWMNEPFTRLPMDWELLRKNGSDWLRYWDTEIRGRSPR